MQSYWIIWFVLIFCVILPSQRRFLQKIRQRKRRGAHRKMPTELLKEYIGKMCTITLYNELSASNGVILAVEENWIKIEEKKRIRLINGDMIRDISIAKQ